MSEQFLELFGGYYNRFTYFTKLPSYLDFTQAYADAVSYALLRAGIIALPFLLTAAAVAFVADIMQVKWKPTSKR
jgi:flagellar biosynthetic protein FlhB